MTAMTLKQKILFKSLLGILTLVAMLPLRVLYVFSDINCFFMHRVGRYRLKLVRLNLRRCFPEKTERQLKQIEHGFYRNFSDYIVETIKLLHISDDEMKRRFRFNGLENLTRIIDDHRSVVAYFSHCFNWEWCTSITGVCPHLMSKGVVFAQIYRPLRNKVFDALMLVVRSRFHSVSVQKNMTLRKLLEYKRDGKLTVTGFMSDQKPSHGDPVHELEFMGLPTNVITGTETLARRLGCGAVYFDLYKVRRGYYRIDIRQMASDASQTPPNALTDMYFSMLERTIRRNPPVWLWSHNRWKNLSKS